MRLFPKPYRRFQKVLSLTLDQFAWTSDEYRVKLHRWKLYRLICFSLGAEMSDFEVLCLPYNGIHTYANWEDRVCKRPQELPYPSKSVLGDF